METKILMTLLATATSVILPILLLTTLSEVSGRKYFTAAVFEHRPRATEEDGPKGILNNLIYFEKAAEVAAEKGADIILFNEFGLFGCYEDRKVLRKFMERVPDPEKERFNPCNDETENLVILPTLSCLAKKHKMFVVANMGDIQPCEGTCDAMKNSPCQDKCPDDGVLMYNTDVAFDREGNLVARYHKMHPYLENFNLPEEPEYITFRTDFGVFGLIVCFDSVFDSSMILAKDYNIDTLLFPTHWFDDVVILNGVEWQQSWAIANGVNFIAANTQTPGNGSIGSGIYTKENGALVYTYEPDGESKLLVANVPLGKASDVKINPSITIIRPDGIEPKVETGDAFPLEGYHKVAGPENDHFLDYRYFKHQTENYTLVKLEKEKGSLQACSNNFCCNLKYEANTMKEDYYLGAFSGLNNVEGFYHWCEESCILVRCDPLEDRPCVMHPSRSNTVFKSLKMGASFTSQRVYPAISKNKHRLAPKNEWQFNMKEQDATLSFKNKNKEPLLKAALLGRCYDRDPEFVAWYRY